MIELNGRALSRIGPRIDEANDPGPYEIAHANFKPAFKILAASDEPQIPWGVLRLEFRDEEGGLRRDCAARSTRRRRGTCRTDIKIAQQNCFRCHNNGAEGGLKSGVTWTVLGALAANSPDFFTAYVRDPKAKNPKTQMAASPEYDDATMRALIAYFRTFAADGGALMLRAAKIALVFAVSIYYSFVVFNNLTDYDSNHQFVRHTLMMDTTFPGNHGMWRAIDSPARAHRVLCFDHRLGNPDHGAVLVGRIPMLKRFARRRRNLSGPNASPWRG